MYVEMQCTCEAGLTLDSDADTVDSVWALAFRFANAHVQCGYMTPGVSAESEPAPIKKRVVKPRRIPEEDEE